MHASRSVAALGVAAILGHANAGPAGSAASFDSETVLSHSLSVLLPPKDPKYSFGTLLSATQLEALSKVLEATSDHTLRYKITAHEGEIDGHLAGGFRGWRSYDAEPPIELTQEMCLFRIEAHGQIRVIELTFDKHKVSAPLEFCFRDRFGNIMQWHADDTSLKLQIMPPTAFGEKNCAESTPLLIDFSAFGLPSEVDCFSRVTFTPLPLESQYPVFTNMDRIETINRFSQHLSAIEAGARACEAFFGHAPGTYVNQIMLANSSSANAYYCCRDPYAIVITDEIIEDGSPLTPIATHETAHLFDNAFGNCSSHLRSLWRSAFDSESGKEFMLRVCESQFLPHAVGGHTQTSPSEFFASFVNSIVSTTPEEWELALERAFQDSSDFPVWYGRFLAAVEPHLHMMSREGAPCLKRLAHMKSFLEAFYERHQLPNPFAPPVT